MKAPDEGTPSPRVQQMTPQPRLAHFSDGELITSQGSLLREWALLLAVSPTSGQAKPYLPVTPSPPPHRKSEVPRHRQQRYALGTVEAPSPGGSGAQGSLTVIHTSRSRWWGSRASSPVLQRRGTPKGPAGRGTLLLLLLGLSLPLSVPWVRNRVTQAGSSPLSLSSPSDWFRDGRVTKILSVRSLFGTSAEPQRSGTVFSC